MKKLTLLIFVLNMVFVLILLLLNSLFAKTFDFFSLHSFLLLLIGTVVSLILAITLKNFNIEKNAPVKEEEPKNLKDKLLIFLDELEKMRVDAGTLQSAYINSLKLFQSIITDPDTNTIIEKHFVKLVDDEIARASRYNLKFGLLILKIFDIDKLAKEVSLKEVIKNISILSKKVLRTVDKVGGYTGGLIYLLPQTNLKGAIRAGERILDSVKNMKAKNKKGEELNIKVSIGVSEYPSHGKNYESLIESAEKNISQAELLGGNQVLFSV